MRVKFSDLPKELFPVNKKFGGIEFVLRRCSETGGMNYLVKPTWPNQISGYNRRGGNSHIQIDSSNRYVEYVLPYRRLTLDQLSKLQLDIETLEISHINVQPYYSASSKVTNLDHGAWNLEPIGAHVTLWVKIPLTEKQSRAVDHAVEAEKERKATEKAKQRAADKAEKDRKGAAQAAREREARLAEAKRVGKTTVTDVAEALMILQKAGLKVVTIEEKK